MYLKKLFSVICISGICLLRQADAQVFYAGEQPAAAQAAALGQKIELRNNLFSVAWTLQGGTLVSACLRDGLLNRRLDFDGKHLFSVVLQDGQVASSGAFKLVGACRAGDLTGNSRAQRLSERYNGKFVQADFVDPGHRLRLRWKATLRDSCNYIEQSFTFSSDGKNTVRKIVLLELPLRDGVHVCGDVDGSPLVSGSMFFALEHPLSKTDTSGGLIRSFLNEARTIDTTQSLSATTAWGVTPAGQLRRGFLYYLEHQRAAPYHQFLHYNSWFDISWSDRKLNDSVCRDRIQCYADSLIVKRHTPLNAFLFDDGWDDDQTLWGFNDGFPNGFRDLQALTGKYHARLGVWISPWGGYDEAKQRRLAYGRAQHPPFETNQNGFSLSGPHYYARFKGVAENFIKNYGVAIFKFDGIGNMDYAIRVAKDADSAKRNLARRDFEALLRLTTALRKDEPDIYLSLTVGTWSSPAWLDYADVTWRSGGDNGQCGAGNERQRWLNYRDKEVYENIVLHAPLYPLNAVMNHGMCIAGNGLPGRYEKDDQDIADEIWSFFGTGTSLQELYIDPHLLSSKDWDCLAAAISWSRRQATVLPDVHWVGGDPGKDEVYGYAAWRGGHGVVTLRNPSGQTKVFMLNNKKIFDLPDGFDPGYRFCQVNRQGGTRPYAEGSGLKVVLQPHEVLVLEATGKP